MNRFVNIVKKINKIRIVEVGARDGLQGENPIPKDMRVLFVNKLSQCGFQQIETGSLVKLKSMQDSDKVYQTINKKSEIEYPLLVLNKKGAEKAAEINAKHISIVISPSNTFCQKNMGKEIPDLKNQISEIMKIAHQNKMQVRGYISTITDCPYEGTIGYNRVSELTEYLLNKGCYEISLGDTTGKATPEQIENILCDIKAKNISTDKLAGHYHDTYGNALNNVIISMNHGVETFDTSIAGLGGCPFAPGAKGNLATQKLIKFLRDNNIHLSLNYERINETSNFICKILGKQNYPIVI